MKKKFKGWQIALLCAVFMLAGVGLSWLASRIPGIQNRGIQLTAACICLGGAAFNLIVSRLKASAKEKRWMKGLSFAVNSVVLAAWIVYGAHLF